MISPSSSITERVTFSSSEFEEPPTIVLPEPPLEPPLPEMDRDDRRLLEGFEVEASEELVEPPALPDPPP